MVMRSVDDPWLSYGFRGYDVAATYEKGIGISVNSLLAYVELQAGDALAAIRTCERVQTTLNQTSAEILLTLALARFATGDTQESLRCYKKALKAIGGLPRRDARLSALLQETEELMEIRPE